MSDIRTAQLSDAAKIFDLVQHTIKETYPKYYPSEIADFFCQLHSEKRIIQDIKAGDVWVLTEDNNEIVGTCSHHENILMRLFVHPKYQKKGYGNLILDQVEALLLTQYNCVLLEAAITACRMYEKRGYSLVNHEKLEVSSSAILVYEIMKLSV